MNVFVIAAAALGLFVIAGLTRNPWTPARGRGDKK